MIVYIGADLILLYGGAFSPRKTDEKDGNNARSRKKSPSAMHCMCWIPPCAGILIRIPTKRNTKTYTGTNTWSSIHRRSQKNGPVYLRDIERRFGITRSTASKVVDMLVRNGFVERHTGETDARLRRLTLTVKIRKPFGRYPRRPRSNGSRFNKGFHAK